MKRFRDPSETSSIVIQIAMFHTQKPQHKKAGSTVVELRVVQAISAVAKKISDENLCVRILMIPHIFHHFSHSNFPTSDDDGNVKRRTAETDDENYDKKISIC